MGDFSLIDQKQGFDLYDDQIKLETGKDIYKNSVLIMHVTFFIYILSAFALFMIFMNFIIAVIGKSYEKVTSFAVAHDYKQKAELIYEREIHFKKDEFENEVFFPEIIIVRKKKEGNDGIDNWHNYAKVMKNFIKEQNLKSEQLVSQRIKDSNDHVVNNIKLLESQLIENMNDVIKIRKQMSKISRPENSDESGFDDSKSLNSNITINKSVGGGSTSIHQRKINNL